MILHYLKVALRNLRKNKTQHLISALCLAIGILTFSFMLCFVYTVGEEEEYIGGERAMRLMISKKDFAGDVPCVEEDFRALKSQTSGMLEGWAVFSYEAGMEVEVVEKDGRETPYKVTYKVATPATFPFWKLPLLYGSRLPEREDEIIVPLPLPAGWPAVRILSDGLSRSGFADSGKWYYGLSHRAMWWQRKRKAVLRERNAGSLWR